MVRDPRRERRSEGSRKPEQDDELALVVNSVGPQSGRVLKASELSDSEAERSYV